MSRPSLRNWRTYELPAKLAVDALIVLFSFLAALALRFDGNIPPESLHWFARAFPFIAALYLSVNVAFGIYRRWWRYAGLHDGLALAGSVSLSTVLLFAADVLAFPSRDFPLSVVIFGGVVTLLAQGVAKLRPRLRRRFALPSRGAPKTARMLIVGAGRSGQMLAHELLQHREWRYRPVCFVDDDPRKQALRVHGLRVAGNRHAIPELVAEHQIDVVTIAIPSAPGAQIRELVTISQATNAKIQIVPGIPELIEGRLDNPILRELTVNDLLGRQSVAIDSELCRQAIQGKTVLVTGAAGSIGQELCRQVLDLHPRRIVMLDNNESGIHDLNVALSLALVSSELESCVADVSDDDQVDQVFGRFRPQVVFHAAAYKHVPLMESHVMGAYRVNVIGTRNVLVAAQRWGAERVTFVSTDKAVRPSNVMGATKRLGELLVMTGTESTTCCCAVRFGNVVGSRGSVVPTFWRQIEAEGPVTVTDPNVSRFFMSVDEAASLIIQATAFATAGEIFMLDMGEEIRIVDLAQKMIRLKGLRPNRDIQIVFTGLRPGEKMQEELLADGEVLRDTAHPKVKRVISEQVVRRADLLDRVERLAKDEPLTKAKLIALLEELDAKVELPVVTNKHLSERD